MHRCHPGRSAITKRRMHEGMQGKGGLIQCLKLTDVLAATKNNVFFVIKTNDVLCVNDGRSDVLP